MQSPSNLFSEVANRIDSAVIFSKILQKQQNTFDIQPYKIENILGENMLKLYLNIQNRYNYAHQRELDPNNWNENQRRVFVWFIVCYTYFLQRENKEMTLETWDVLSHVFFGKNPEFLHFQYLNILRNIQRITWTPEEDQTLIKCVKAIRPGKWNEISKKIFYESNRRIFRTPKHCRQRWLNHLDQSKKHGAWTNKEDLLIFDYVNSFGKRWSKVVSLLNQSRTQHMIKNRYNSLIAKFKGSKKPNEQEIVKKIIKQLSKSVQAQQQNKKSNQLRSQVKKQVEKKQNSTVQFVSQINPEPQLQGMCAPIISNPFTQNMQFGCYYDCNYYFINNFCMSLPNISILTYQGTNALIQFSKQSNFSVYKPENMA